MNYLELAELINNTQRVATLSTANETGAPNTAVIGSAYLATESQLWVGLGNNRTSENLRENPKAVLLAVHPGENILQWKGVRIYLHLTSMEFEGDRFDQLIDRIENKAGRMAARSIRRLAIFRISEVRPLIDLSGG